MQRKPKALPAIIDVPVSTSSITAGVTKDITDSLTLAPVNPPHSRKNSTSSHIEKQVSYNFGSFQFLYKLCKKI